MKPTRRGRTRPPKSPRSCTANYQLVVDAIGERLYDLRETYAATLDGGTAAEYRAAFDRAATKRFGRLAAFLEEAS